MSEKIYAWLLRLYPSRFREAYGDEALQLFRDRSRDERGFFSRVRLWLDLLGDLALSLPMEYFRVQPEVIRSSARLSSKNGPSFLVLANQPLGAGALLSGSALSLAALITFSVLLNHGVRPVPLSALIHPTSGVVNESSSHFSPSTPRVADNTEAGAGASTSQEQPTIASTSSQWANGEASDAQSRPPKQQSQQPEGTTNPAGRDARFDKAECERVIEAAVANLKEHYIDPAIAQKMEEALLSHENAGDYDTITDGAAFATLLTRQLRDVSHDMHLEVVYSKTPLPERSTGPSPERFALYRKAMEQHNCTFEKVEITTHNIGYLKLNSFPDPSICESTAKTAMASLNHADALIFDLRDNRGGYPSMVMLIAAYLFDHPEYMYNPGDMTERSWTQSPVPGNRLADKPVYVLTSARTFSGAEHFSYDLKMLKRATLVGETTGGATDVGVFHRIDDHFGMGIRETRAINPYAEPDWAVTGVGPDVKVKAADALQTAMKLAESKLAKK
jgi:hypothetical protein